MTKNMGIYKINNEVNGKFYIGSSVDLKKRRRDHLRELRDGIHRNNRLQNSFNKYGERNFKFSIIEYVENEKVLREKEQHWIDKTDACNRYKGFNINRLATGGGNYEEDNGNYGNKGIKNPLSKQVAQIDPATLKVIKIWGASIEIKRELDFHSGNICNICTLIEEKNLWKKYKGYYWCYEKDLHRLENKIDYIDPRKRRVMQLDKNTKEVLKIFDSLKEAADEVGVGYINISRVCNGKNETSAGYRWKFADEGVYKPNKTSLTGKENPNARKVVQLSLDGKYIRVYSTIKQAAIENSISVNGIYQYLSSKTRKHSGGYQWMYYEDYQALTK